MDWLVFVVFGAICCDTLLYVTQGFPFESSIRRKRYPQGSGLVFQTSGALNLGGLNLPQVASNVRKRLHDLVDTVTNPLNIQILSQVEPMNYEYDQQYEYVDQQYQNGPPSFEHLPRGPPHRGPPPRGLPHRGPPHGPPPHYGPPPRPPPHYGPPPGGPPHHGPPPGDSPHYGPPPGGPPHHGPPPGGPPHHGPPPGGPSHHGPPPGGPSHHGPPPGGNPHHGPPPGGPPHYGPPPGGPPHHGPPPRGRPHGPPPRGPPYRHPPGRPDGPPPREEPVYEDNQKLPGTKPDFSQQPNYPGNGNFEMNVELTSSTPPTTTSINLDEMVSEKSSNISEYIEDNFPVILLNENEIR